MPRSPSDVLRDLRNVADSFKTFMEGLKGIGLEDEKEIAYVNEISKLERLIAEADAALDAEKGQT